MSRVPGMHRSLTLEEFLSLPEEESSPASAEGGARLRRFGVPLHPGLAKLECRPRGWRIDAGGKRVVVEAPGQSGEHVPRAGVLDREPVLSGHRTTGADPA